jgi:hypothetical protein
LKAILEQGCFFVGMMGVIYCCCRCDKFDSRVEEEYAAVKVCDATGVEKSTSAGPKKIIT